MRMLTDYCRILSCPDDGSSLRAAGTNVLECSGCGRHFSLLKSNFAEIIPSKFPGWDLSEKNRRELMSVEESYKDIFHREFRQYENPAGWGDLSAANPGHRAFIKAEIEFVQQLIHPSRETIAVDISGGVGNYSIPLSTSVKAMFHCELDVESIQTAHSRGAADNIFFVRAPYLKLPFIPGIFDYVVCTDTLIRGKNHEIKLLKEINRILKPGGMAIVDFHNTRPFIRDHSICLYNSKQISSLLREAGISQFKLYPFGHVPSFFVLTEFFYPVMDRMFSIAPSQRYIVVFTK